ncbi:hypothetical protein JVX90_09700 [Gordonia sp. PDNC005]|uniref:LppU/SCO3897 family protein n=1 Tax=unclassified Gordonia (in: high G+C Gram-positive bacteria) TaxID=2657482 RepID=UPI0019654888|nr:hypothetical protein [Gordonia sp. PDNC005]QRY64411.1 hypothetical protein JVX90_09700 [Gordonia sp. PDNC005]
MTTPPHGGPYPQQPNPQQPGNYDQTQIGQPAFGQPSTPQGPGPQGAQGPQQVYGQPPAYGQNPFSQPTGGQAPYGQPPYGQQQYGQSPHGQPPFQQPPTPQNSSTRIVIAVVAVMAVIAFGGLAFLVFGSGDDKKPTDAAASSSSTTPFTLPTSTTGDGTTVDSSPVGSCITVRGSTSVTTESASCSSSRPTFIVAAKLSTSRGCDAAKYPFSVTEYSSRGRDNVMCLVPNYQVGTCYTQSQFSVGISLETVSCSQDSTTNTTNFKITERSESSSVPDCSDSDKQRSDTFTIRTSPARKLTICREILGDYVWK